MASGVWMARYDGIYSDKLRESQVKTLLHEGTMGFHASHDELKLEDAPMKEQGDMAFDRKQKSKALLVEKDDASSMSSYESNYDTDDEADGDAAIPATTFQDDTVPLPRGTSSQPPSSTRRESREPHLSRAWYEFDLAVIVALLSPIGNWLTGGDHVKNLFLILLLIFYLHHLIEGGSSDSILERLRTDTCASTLESLSIIKATASSVSSFKSRCVL